MEFLDWVQVEEKHYKSVKDLEKTSYIIRESVRFKSIHFFRNQIETSWKKWCISSTVHRRVVQKADSFYSTLMFDIKVYSQQSQTKSSPAFARLSEYPTIQERVLDNWL